MAILQETRGFDSPGYAGDPSASRIEEAIAGAALPITIADARRPHDPILYANPAFLALTGYAAEEVVGRNCRFLQGPETDGAAVDQIRAALRTGRPVTVELLNYRKDGVSFWNALHLSPVRDRHGEVAYFLGSQRDVTARKLADLELRRRHDEMAIASAENTRRLEQALAQKVALLQEVDHRAKNNLQLISSLLLLQSRRTSSEVAAAALRRMLARVNAIGAVHRRLFQTERLDRFELAPFVGELVDDVARSVRGAQVRTKLDSVQVPAGHAAPIALIVSELVTNALRHAYPGGQGEVTVLLRRQPEGFELLVEDGGIGIGESPPGFGLTIAQLLCQQVGGTLSLEREGAGLRASVFCPQPRAA